MRLELASLLLRARRLSRRPDLAGPLQAGMETALTTGDHLGLGREDFLARLRDLASRLAPGFTLPLEKAGARLLVTVDSLGLAAGAAEVTALWRLLEAAGESWTIPATGWEGLNWAAYLGDEDGRGLLAERLMEAARRLEVQAILLPLSGHAHLAVRLALDLSRPDQVENMELLNVFDLLAGYVREGRLNLDRAGRPGPAAVHDACQFGRRAQRALGQAYYDQVRFLARQCCGQVVDLEPSREYELCCGGGGGLEERPAGPEVQAYRRLKARQLAASPARLVVVPCRGCREALDRLAAEAGLDLQVKHLLSLMAESLKDEG
jgi:Fe-S oxidoreductase